MNFMYYFVFSIWGVLIQDSVQVSFLDVVALKRAVDYLMELLTSTPCWSSLEAGLPECLVTLHPVLW